MAGNGPQSGATTSSAARQKRYRERKKTAGQVRRDAAATGRQVDARAAAVAVEAARSEATAEGAPAAALREALEVGRCCRTWEEVAAGQTAGEAELADWIAGQPALLYLFLAWVAASGTGPEYSRWWSDWSGRVGP